MNKTDFLADDDVKSFLAWLEEGLPKLEICLDIKRSRFVPSPLKIKVTGLDNVLTHYSWKSYGMTNGDWVETRSHLSALASSLRSAVKSGIDTDVLMACRNILLWGGNRDWNKGAYRFLNAKAKNKNLCDYIIKTGAAFSLSTANLNNLVHQVELLNSMLTKVHALYAIDGLPIYDSRVAAAIASLVEMWRVANGKSGDPLSPQLAFPATMTSRTVLRLYPQAKPPGVMTYGALMTAKQWASSKIRLGWIMESTLQKSPKLFSGCCSAASLTGRMHAFEASLFMIGYDVTCLDCVLKRQPNKIYKRPRLSKKRASRVESELKTIMPLSGKGKPISYDGDVTTGFKGNWGRQSLDIEADLLEQIQIEFCGRHDVPLGANRTGSEPEGSFGQWLLDEGWYSRQYASAIAAILNSEGIISTHRKKGHSIYLDFSD